jgi:hypothetical protein
MMEKTTEKTITWTELRRLAFCNSKELPEVVNHDGRAKRWVGIGWVEEGPATEDMVKVVEG